MRRAAVHHAPVDPEDDRVRQVDSLDEPSVVHHPPNRWSLGLAVEPVDGVDLVDRRQLDLFHREWLAELDQAVDVPSVETVLSRPGVMLLSPLDA
jgi:hypothetical protein